MKMSYNKLWKLLIDKDIYDIPEGCGTIKVKITDLLSESLEVEVR